MGRRRAPEGSATFLFLARVALLMLLSSPVSALTWSDDQVQLTIRFAEGKNQFRQGEVIAVELHFSTSAPDTYTVSTRSYDRSGRLDIDQVVVTPSTRDPLHDYYSGLLGGFLGGGLSGFSTLGQEPYVYRMEINEWVAFDSPGRYTIEITSSRISRTDPLTSQAAPVVLRSNRLEFEIVGADAAWQAHTLADTIATLDSAASDDMQRSRARSVLRFLDSPAALAEVVRRLGDPEESDRWDWKAALLATRHRSLAKGELERGLTAPDVALTYDYVSVLAALRFLLEHPEPMPPYPPDKGPEQEAWRALLQQRHDILQGLIDSVYQQALRALDTKQGRAKAVTLHHLIAWPDSNASRRREAYGRMAPELASLFAMLPMRQQEEMLQYRWSRIRSPAMLPVLRRILDQPKQHSHELREAAFRRLLELDPSEGAARILREIRQPRHDSGTFVSPRPLGLLPGGLRPELDDLLATRLGECWRDVGTRCSADRAVCIEGRCRACESCVSEEQAVGV